MIQYTCPPADRWTALLCEDLPADEQAELQYHLEQCPECQHVLDHCVAERNDWDEVPRWLASCSEADAKLKTVIDRLKNADDTSGVTDMTIDFIDPTEREGSLGRLNNYEIIGEIGRGGMGVVLKALDPALHRVVAIKVLAPQLAVSAAARKRFTREARAAAAVCHEHVVTIHSVEEFKSLPYLVMQYVAGQSLQQKLESHGPLPVADILRIGMQAAAGLAAAHAQGLVHRDIKPGNILLENGVERVRITDFGLARTIDDVAVTQSGVIAGTPQYMAPEQTRGHALDARTDLFSLGSVMYAMCTGETPFPGHHALDVIRKVGEDRPTPIREVNYAIPPWLEAIVAKLMAKDPAQRFQSAAEVAHLLERCLAHVQNPRATPLPAALTSVQQFAPAGKNSLSRRIALVLPILAGLFVVTEATGATHILKALGTVLRIRTPEGTLVLEVDDPAIKVSLDDKDLVITGAGAQEIRLKVGAHTVRAAKDGQSKTEIVTIEKDGKATLKVSLENDGFRLPVTMPNSRPAQDPYVPDLPRFTFATHNQPWSAVLEEFAKLGEMPVNMRAKPAGTFSYMAAKDDKGQPRRYRLGELIDILNESLMSQNMLLVRRSKDFVVVPIDQPVDPVLYANVPSYELEQRGATELVNAMMRYEFLRAADAQAAAKPLLSQLGNAEVLPGDSLSLSDKAENVRRILKRLALLEQQLTWKENKTGHGAAPQPGPDAVNKTGQVPVPAPPIVRPNNPVTSPSPAPPINLPGAMDPNRDTLSVEFRNQPWNDVLETLSTLTGLPVEQSGQPPTGSFSLTPRRDLTIRDLIDVLNESLLEQQFLLVRQPKTIKLLHGPLIDQAYFRPVKIAELPSRGRTELARITYQFATPRGAWDKAQPGIRALRFPGNVANLRTEKDDTVTFGGTAANLMEIVKLLREADAKKPADVPNDSRKSSTPAQQPAGSPDGSVRFVHFVDWPWAEVLKWYSEQIQLPLEAKTLPKGHFTFEPVERPGEGAVHYVWDAQNLDVLNEALQLQNLLLVRNPKSLNLISTDGKIDPANYVEKPIDQLDKLGKTELALIRYPLERGQAIGFAKHLVEPLLTKRGEVFVAESAQTLIIRDTVGSLQNIVREIKWMDRPPADPPPVRSRSGNAGVKRYEFEVKNKPWPEVFNWLTKITGVPVTSIDKPTGTFSFIGPGSSTEKPPQYTLSEIRDLINDALMQQKLLLVRRTDDFKVISTENKIDRVGIKIVSSKDVSGLARTELAILEFQPRNVSARSLEPVIQPLLSRLGEMSIDERRNTLLICDIGGKLKYCVELLVQGDRASEPPRPMPVEPPAGR